MTTARRPTWSRAGRLAGASILTVMLGAWLAVPVATTTPRFYSDDPIDREPESQDASRAVPYDITSMYEMVYNPFVTADYKPTGRRAMNLNTVDEVPDSSWFTNRLGTTALSLEDLARGPNRGLPPDPARWVVTRQKVAGVHP